MHRWLGGTALAFTGVHVIALLADQYIHFGPSVDPDPASPRPGIRSRSRGASSPSTCSLAVELTSLARSQLSKKAWRRVHTASFVLFVTATIHGLSAGTDTKSAVGRIIAFAVCTVFVGLTALRVSEVRALADAAPPSPARRST